LSVNLFKNKVKQLALKTYIYYNNAMEGEKMDDILLNAEEKMESAIESMEKRFNNVRAGRANPAILDAVMVNYYGTPTPLKSLATISIPEARQLMIKPFDRGSLPEIEKGIYEKILAEPEVVVQGTVKELAEKYGVELLVMVGFLDGINESLIQPNPIETMTEDTVVNLGYDRELLYKNMVEAKAEWLYTLEAWNTLIPSDERRKELYKEQKSSHTIVKDKKVGRNDPCPCGSGKKYKHCCGR